MKRKALKLFHLPLHPRLGLPMHEICSHVAQFSSITFLLTFAKLQEHCWRGTGDSFWVHPGYFQEETVQPAPASWLWQGYARIYSVAFGDGLCWGCWYGSALESNPIFQENLHDSLRVRRSTDSQRTLFICELQHCRSSCLFFSEWNCLEV